MDLEKITDEDYFSRLKEMFTTVGWAVFQAEMASNAQLINSVEDTDTVNELFFRKGQLAILGNILNMESTIEMAEKEATIEDSE